MIGPQTMTKSNALKDKFKTLEAEVEALKEQVRASESLTNSNEQLYSRRNHIRIRGLIVNDGDYKRAVAHFCTNQLSLRNNNGKYQRIEESDIDAAHPLPVRSQGSRPGSADSLPTIIVRFHQRDLRDNIIRSRKLLKGKKITISEDLTARNQQLLSKLRAS